MSTKREIDTFFHHILKASIELKKARMMGILNDFDRKLLKEIDEAIVKFGRSFT